MDCSLDSVKNLTKRAREREVMVKMNKPPTTPVSKSQFYVLVPVVVVVVVDGMD